MNIFKILLVLVTGTGVGFGIDRISDTTAPESSDIYYSESHCYEDQDTFHFFRHYDEETRGLIEEKLNELLVEYDITLNEFYQDYTLHREIMNQLHQFIDENDFTIETNNFYGHHHRRWQYEEGDTE